MANHIESAASRMENLSITGDDTAEVKGPLANLPLPRELRDKVWEYLLLTHNVRDAPYHSRSQEKRGQHSESNKRADSIAHTYHFHINVLAVNRQIRKEALPILNSNHFVLVTHRWPKAAILKHGLGLPIVTENQAHVSKFRGTVILKLQFVAPSTHAAHAGHAQPSPESFLMVADDLPALTTAFQWMIYSSNTQALIVARRNTGPEYHNMVKQDPHAFGLDGMGTRPSLTVRFPVNNGEFIDPAIQTTLFRPLSTIACGRMEIKVHNIDFSLSSFFDAVLPTMSPGSIHLRAMVWHIIETARDFKQKADELAANGDTDHAMIWYSHIWHLRTSCPLFVWDESRMLLVEHIHSDTLEAIAILNSLMLKAAVAEGLLRIRSGVVDPEADDLRLDTIHQTIKLTSYLTHPVCCSIKPALALSSYHTNTAYFVHGLSGEHLTGVLESMEKAAAKLLVNNAEGWGVFYDHFLHDLEVIRHYANDKEARNFYLRSNPSDPSILQTLRKSLAASKFDFEPIPLSEVDGQAKPEGLVGLTDKPQEAALRAFSSAVADGLLGHEVEGPIAQMRGSDFSMIGNWMGITHRSGLF